jgi:thiol-disulfide isomerase/thioredoxin
MYRLIAGVLLLALTGLVVRADDKPGKEDKPAKDKPVVKEDKDFKALEKEFLDKIRSAKPAERKKVLESYSPRFLAFAEKNPKDASAFDALIYVLRMSAGTITKDSPAAKAQAILEKDHIKHKNIGSWLTVFGQLGDDGCIRILKAIVENHPDRKTQGKALKTVVKTREEQVQIANQSKSNEKIRQFYEQRRGKEYVKNAIDNVGAFKKEAAEYKKLFAKYSDVIPDLSIGKKAPEIVSKDLDGKEVKLSQLKGKVVVLDIWATWCPPCKAMIPHERELVKRLKDKPFVLVSISGDAKKETVTEFLKKEPMPWTHWWNGASGGIIEDWEVRFFPTIYVLDAKGVIRYKDVRGKAMDEAVDTLLKEMEKKSDKKDDKKEDKKESK